MVFGAQKNFIFLANMDLNKSMAKKMKELKYSSIEDTEAGQRPVMFGEIGYMFDFYLLGPFSGQATPIPVRDDSPKPILVRAQKYLRSMKHSEGIGTKLRGYSFAPSNIAYRILHQAQYSGKPQLTEIVEELQETDRNSMICTSSILVEHVGNPRGGYPKLCKRYRAWIKELLNKGKLTEDSALLIHFAYINPAGEVSSHLDKIYPLRKMPRIARSTGSSTWIYTLNKTDQDGRPNPNGEAEVDSFLSHIIGFPVEVLPRISERNGLTLGRCNVLENGSSSLKSVLLTIPRRKDEFPSIILSSVDYYAPVGLLIKPDISGVRARNLLWSRRDKGARRQSIPR